MKRLKVDKDHFKKMAEDLAALLSIEQCELAKAGSTQHHIDSISLLRRKNKLLKKQLSLCEKIMNRRF